jgi:midasin (ATPase involved in ribosome maturation)
MPDDLQSDIQATAEDIAADSEVLKGIETEKSTIDATDPRALELATQAEALAHEIATKATAERELVHEANGLGPSGAPEREPAG